MNNPVGIAEENGTVMDVREYMRAGDDDSDIRVIKLTLKAALGALHCTVTTDRFLRR